MHFIEDMMGITKLPSCRFLFIFITAILINRYFNWPIGFNINLGSGLISLFLSYISYRFDKRLISNLLLYISLFCLSLAFYHFKVEIKPSNHLSHFHDNLSEFKGVIISYPYCQVCLRWDNKIIKRQVYIVHIEETQKTDEKKINVTGKILVKSQAIIASLKMGDEIIIKGKAFSIRNLKSNSDKKSKCIPYWQYENQNNALFANNDNKLNNGFEQFNYQEFLADNGIDYVSYPWKNANIIIEKRQTFNGLQKIASKTHYFIEDLYRQYLPELEQSLVKGLILGKKQEIPNYVQNNFRLTGIYHILAVSGLHVAMLAVFLYFILRLLRLPVNLIVLITMVILICYIFVVGEKPAILRAVIMYVCGGLVLILDKDRNWLNPLFLAGFCILVLKPLTLFNIGFQLSFLATLGIIIFYQKINHFFLKFIKYDKIKTTTLPYFLTKGLSGLLKRLVSLISLTVSAQFLIIPILLYYFKGISYIAVLSNIVIIPLTQLAIGLGFFLPIVSFSDFLLTIYSGALEYILKAILGFSNFLAEFPINYLNINIKFWSILLYYLISILLFLYDTELKNKLLKKITDKLSLS